MSIQTSLNTELIYDNKDIWLLKLIGTINPTNHHLLWHVDSYAVLAKKVLETEAKTLIIDLTEVKRMDSQGLRHFYDLYRAFVSTDVQIILKNPSKHLKRIFHIVQFDKIFTIEFDDKDVLP